MLLQRYARACYAARNHDYIPPPLRSYILHSTSLTCLHDTSVAGTRKRTYLFICTGFKPIILEMVESLVQENKMD